MKKFLGTTLLAMLSYFAISQPNQIGTLQGYIYDSSSHLPLSGAVVLVNEKQVITDEKGFFTLGKLSIGNYLLSVKSIGFSNYQQNVSIGNTENRVRIALIPYALFLQPLEVKSVRAGDRAPFAKTNLTKEQIVKNNLGQDLPFLLNQTPSVVVNSDAGNGVGYTGIRIRGSDATRINVTLNGIPYNDAESMGTYFVDLPDFSSSVNSIQVQRGVGT